MKNIAVIVGSVRKESFSKKVALNMMEMFREDYELELVPIELDLYNQDLDEGDDVPESWRIFREKMKTKDAVLFVTPEYNRSVPGVLKNALDVGSRSPTESVWSRKPAAVVSNSPSNLGAFGANHHLRQSLVFFDMPVVQQPEVYLSGVAEVFDEKGKFNNDRTTLYVQKLIDKFVEVIEKNE